MATVSSLATSTTVFRPKQITIHSILSCRSVTPALGRARNNRTTRISSIAPEEEKKKKKKKTTRYFGTYRREKTLEELIQTKVIEAKEVCAKDERSDGCRVAWDEVEEVSQAKADLRRKIVENGGGDPLEAYCQENPETDECRVYED